MSENRPIVCNIQYRQLIALEELIAAAKGVREFRLHQEPGTERHIRLTKAIRQVEEMFGLEVQPHRLRPILDFDYEDTIEKGQAFDRELSPGEIKMLADNKTVIGTSVGDVGTLTAIGPDGETCVRVLVPDEAKGEWKWVVPMPQPDVCGRGDEIVTNDPNAAILENNDHRNQHL